MRPADYLSDADLQSLISAHPALLGGMADNAGSWLALERNGPSPPTALLTPQWSVDHLFLSRDGVPTVVETRRGAGERENGDLFGQVLYYAANAEMWWPMEEMRKAFAVTSSRTNVDANATLSAFIGEGRAPGVFWDHVAANLAAGRVRMVLAVDKALPEMVRMVQFLDGQLREAEVWVLEVKQHLGPSGRVLQTAVVSRSSGSTSPTPPSVKPVKPADTRVRLALDNARDVAPAPLIPRPAPLIPRPAPRGPSPQEVWASSLRARCDGGELAALDDVLRWMREQYGQTLVTGLPSPALWLSVIEEGRERFPVGLTAAKTVTLHLGALSVSPAYEPEDARRALVKELASTGLVLPSVDIGGDVAIPIKDLASPELRAKVIAVFDGVIETLRMRETVNTFFN